MDFEMIRLMAIVFCLVGMTIAVNAQWNGFPFETNTNQSTYAWDSCEQTFQPVSQLFWAATERCLIAGATTPTNIQTWTCYGGTNWDGTNLTLLSTNIMTTNYFGWFTYTDHNSTIRTAKTYTTKATIDLIDQTIASLCTTGQFVSTNYLDYLDNVNTNGEGSTIAELRLSKAQLFREQNIGHPYPSATNFAGIIPYSAVDESQFTAYPETSHSFVLAEATYLTNIAAWTSHVVSADTPTGQFFTATMTNFPVLRFYGSGTGDVIGTDFAIVGKVRIWTNGAPQTYALNLTNETITYAVDSTNMVLTNMWYSIDSMYGIGSTASNHDTFAVVYTNRHVLYGEMPYVMTLKDLDERWTAINNLRWTYIATSLLYPSNTIAGAVYDPEGGGTWQDAIDECIADFAAGWTNGNYQYDISMRYVGYYDGLYWLFGFADKSIAYATNIYTNIAHTAVPHLKQVAITNTVTGFTNIWRDFASIGGTSGVTIALSAMPEGNYIYRESTNIWVDPFVSIPPELTDFPDTNFHNYYQAAEWDSMVLKWDGTNGLTYK